MNLIYKGIDITDSVDIKKADIYDNAGGKADSIELVFADTQKLWSEWKPQKGDEINLLNDGFSSGKMFIDERILTSGKFCLKAISTPINIKSNSFKSWEKIRFKKIANDLANSSGLITEFYNITDYLYNRIDQNGETDLELLNNLCIREGYTLKITNGKAIIYSEYLMEKVSPVVSIHEYDFQGDYEFKDVTRGLKRQCIVRWTDSSGKLIKFDFRPNTAPNGGVLKVNERVDNEGEAERFTKGYLRNINKFESVGKGVITLNTSIAAGNTAEILDMGIASGNYFIYGIIHRLVSNTSSLFLRKPLEGY